MSFWTNERVETLIRLWGEGNSASIIARMMKAPSRSAVIGKAFRLALVRRTTAHRDQRQYRRVKVAVDAAKPKPAPAKKQHIIGPDPWTPRPVEVVPEADRVTIYALEPHHCRYPFGEGAGISFCGRKKVAGLSYCASHSRTCFTASSVPIPQEVPAARELEPAQ